MLKFAHAGAAPQRKTKMTTVLSARNITKRFSEKEEVLKGIDVDFYENSFAAVLGPSGSGKSTLLNIVSGLIKPTEGSVDIGGQDITVIGDRALAKIKRNDIGYIFQNYLLLGNLTAGENILIGAPDRDRALCVDRLAEILDITDVMKKFPAELSGGQQQRVAIARAVIKKPKLLFCDEATGALDEPNSKKVVGLLHSVKNTFGLSVVFITHNLSIAQTADRVITLKNGLIVSDKTNASPISADEMAW